MYNPYTLENKKILVTGASSGIGKATAIECAKLGASVIVTARNEERLKAVYNELDRSIGQEHQMVKADLATNDGLDFLVSSISNIDGVSSNAGIIVLNAPIKFLKEEVMENVYNVNTLSHVKLARDLFKKKKINKNASYVFTVSVGGVTAFNVGNSAYGMAKAALNAFMKFCAVDFSTRGIRCNSVCPGMIETPMTDTNGIFTEEDYKRDMQHYLLKRYGRPEEVAWTTAFLLSDASSFITGHALMVDGGASLVK